LPVFLKKLYVRYLIFVLVATAALWPADAQKHPGRVKGYVGKASDKEPLSGANIINLTQLTGTITNEGGFFAIGARPGDTLLISYMGYKVYKMTVDSSSFKGVHRIYLQQEPVILQEVVIKGHDLTGVLPVDLALVPVQPIQKIDLHLEWEFGDTTQNAFTRLNDQLRKISDPVGLIYNFFSAHGKDLRKLRKLQERDEVYQMLTKRFDRKILSELLNVPPEEVYRVLQWCDYDEAFLRRASDIQILEALKQCYEQHKLLMNQGQ